MKTSNKNGGRAQEIERSIRLYVNRCNRACFTPNFWSSIANEFGYKSAIDARRDYNLKRVYLNQLKSNRRIKNEQF